MQKLIFIVDDNDSNLTMAASALDKEYKVLTMPSAIKMFSLLEKKQPDMILLDIEMPEMTGFEAIVKLKENPDWKNIPVVFLTGHEEDSIETKAAELGALSVIRKPIKLTMLLNFVNKYLG